MSGDLRIQSGSQMKCMKCGISNESEHIRYELCESFRTQGKCKSTINLKEPFSGSVSKLIKNLGYGKPSVYS